MSRWDELTARLLDEVGRCDPIYRPTSFWGPGVRTILDDMTTRGLERFKSWPSASTWFYPTYGNEFTSESIDATYRAAQQLNPSVKRAWFRAALGGRQQAQRDFDAARLAWDQTRWPFALDGLGESEAGDPSETFQLDRPSAAVWTRPYLNYLLCLAALSRHVDSPPQRFVELGGGFGVLGEIVLSRDAEATYIDLDLAPLLTVASFYLDTLFGDRVTTYDALPATGPLETPGSACLPSWRIGDLNGAFDVFVNSYSFQEMEPDVVERYVADVANLGVSWAVSLNSRDGKAVRSQEGGGGVLTPVTSRAIVDLFEARGFSCVATYGEPLIHSQAELAILRRTDGPRGGGPGRRQAKPARSADAATSVDLRHPFTGARSSDAKAERRASPGRRQARGGIAGRARRLLRRMRRWLP